jgi:transcriptional regulator with XRE-family HTH domain
VTPAIGEALRSAREAQGRSLDEAAAATLIKPSFLEALEQERFGDLGGSVYVKGFLRAYAGYLGLNPAPLLEAYRAQERPEPVFAYAPRARQRPRPRRPGPLGQHLAPVVHPTHPFAPLAEISAFPPTASATFATSTRPRGWTLRMWTRMRSEPFAHPVSSSSEAISPARCRASAGRRRPGPAGSRRWGR